MVATPSSRAHQCQAAYKRRFQTFHHSATYPRLQIMPSISFEGATNFSVTGGNFGEVAGNVTNVHFGSGLRPLSFLRRASATNYGNQPDLSRHVHFHGERFFPDRARVDSPPPRARISSVPSSGVSESLPTTNATSESDQGPRETRPRPVSLTTAPQDILSSPVSTSSSAVSEDDDDFHTAISQPADAPSPDTPAEPSSLVPPSIGPINQRQTGTELLTPLTNSLNLNSRLTLNPRLERFPPVYEASIGTQVQQQGPPPLYEASEPRRVITGNPSQHLPQPHRQNSAPSSMPLRTGDRPSVDHARSSHTALQRELSNMPESHRPAMTTSALVGTAPQVTAVPITRAASLPLGGPSASEAIPANLEDPAARFTRLQSQRPSTKGYASDLPQPPTTVPVSQTRAAVRQPPQGPRPCVQQETLDPQDDTTTSSTVSELSDSDPDAHWTPSSIQSWAGHVSGGDGGENSGPSRQERNVQPCTCEGQHQQHPHNYSRIPNHYSVSYPVAPCTNHCNEARRNSLDAAWNAPQYQPQYTDYRFNAIPYPYSGFSFNHPFINGSAFGTVVYGAPQMGCHGEAEQCRAYACQPILRGLPFCG
ncbi:hypothetical protein AN958_04017 [Leucoagaricus sp. SymC.cos]|nr:hypothetical protein AN958_04017 [Leucoagaricus sp. SymC.cos]